MKIERGARLEILRQIEEHGPSYGLEIVARANGLPKGTVYVTLGRLVDDGLLQVLDGHPRRHELTGLGRLKLRASVAARAAYRASEATA